jgi:hypothetical protein
MCSAYDVVTPEIESKASTGLRNDGKDDDWLFDLTLIALTQVPGCPERTQIRSLMDEALVLRLGDDVSRAIKHTLAFAPNSIARHADCFDPPTHPVWLEYASDPQTNGDPNQGILIAKNPSYSLQSVGFVVSKDKEGNIHLSYAVLHWNAQTLSAVSSADSPLDELIEETKISIPPGFFEELLVWQSPDSEEQCSAIVQQAKRIAFEAAAPAITAWLLIESAATRLTEAGLKRIAVSMKPLGWIERIYHRGMQNQGFCRGPLGMLRWSVSNPGQRPDRTKHEHL